MSGKDQRIDVAALRESLAGRTGAEYWRSLEELAGTERFREFLAAEFPSAYPEREDDVSRRQFVALMGASLALAGVTSACTRQPRETIIPYVQPPEEMIPGRPLFYATAATLQGYALGVLAESQMGRPVKIEGNPDHPSSLGATDLFAQASVLGLYDPDRSQTVQYLADIRPWSEFLTAMHDVIEGLKASRGKGLRILTGTVTSPTLAWQMDQLLAAFPEARWHQHEAASRDGARAGAAIAFGEPVSIVHRFDRADVILALDSDFLFEEPGSVRYARDFSRRRRAGDPGAGLNRLYAVESTPSITGSVADHRFPVRSSEVGAIARAIATGLGVDAGGAPPAAALSAHSRWIEAVVRDLKRTAGSSLVIAGPAQPAYVHALAHAMNHALGNIGRTVVLVDPIEAGPRDQTASLARLAEEMEAGQVGVLMILDSNPAYTAPPELRFAERMDRVGIRVHLGLYDDETARLCHWHIPRAHDLESWSDARGHDGTATILQPLIEPLYQGKTPHDLVAVLMGGTRKPAYDLLRDYWRTRLTGADFDKQWDRAVHDGVIAGTAAAERTLPPRAAEIARAAADAPDVEAGAMEIVFRPDPSVLDGRFANNGWLQEIPRPLTKITWDNALLVSPADAAGLGLSSEDVVEIDLRGRKVAAPVWVTPGHAPGSVTVHLGQGRRRAGRVGASVGFDAYALRPATPEAFAAGVRITPLGRRWAIACTQEHHGLEGRPIIRTATPAEALQASAAGERRGEHGAPAVHGEAAAGDAALEHEAAGNRAAAEGHLAPGPQESMYPPKPYPGHAWGMAVDVNACIGCNACMVACNAENNIAVVGKVEVLRGREMHWLRIDTYHAGDLENPASYHQPMMCQHCEDAPCELVCPVGATVHSSEGLNDMVYNRCVGTRYCSNNCPYKVRRFNFRLYQDWTTPSLKMLRNPDVTVRSRGVMEKCTYCVQRINEARIAAHREDRDIRDGEIVTACQQACPAEAIVFGDINDPQSRVSKLKARSTDYGVLEELGTRPRTTYSAVVRNPNPEIAKG